MASETTESDEASEPEVAVDVSAAGIRTLP